MKISRYHGIILKVREFDMNINYRFYNHISGNDSADDNDDSKQDIGTVLERKNQNQTPVSL